MFHRQSPQQMAEIRQAVAAGDPCALERAAHHFKGSIGFFSTGPAFEAAARLERIGREGPWDLADTTCNDLQRGLDELTAALSDPSLEVAS
jgi:HPt (histidine-containing phosphotransfer) domain-containing protein